MFKIWKLRNGQSLSPFLGQEELVIVYQNDENNEY